MRAWVFILGIAGSLTSCSSAGLSPGAISLSRQTEPFPHNYLAWRTIGVAYIVSRFIETPARLLGRRFATAQAL